MSPGLFDSDDIRIAITDSGLGGVSIAAETARRMASTGIFRKAEIIFYNALFSNEGGYNSLPDRRDKIRIFDLALKGLRDNFNPDIIIIGCNTLSVIYGETDFARNAGIPVVGIVETGVDLIARNLDSVPGSTAILFGTPTTIEEGLHESMLQKRGFTGERIIGQACPDLTEYIELGYNSAETEMLIAAYVDEALGKMGNHPEPFFASLNCTHFGYSIGLWEKAFESFGASPLAILDPNKELLHFLFPRQMEKRYDKSEISVKVVSKVEIDKTRLVSIAGFIQEISPETARALLGYEHREDLFHVD